jgi:hypothetical protein
MQPTLFIQRDGDYSFKDCKIAYTIEKETNSYVFLKPYGLYNLTDKQIMRWHNTDKHNIIRRKSFNIMQL